MLDCSSKLIVRHLSDTIYTSCSSRPNPLILTGNHTPSAYGSTPWIIASYTVFVYMQTKIQSLKEITKPPFCIILLPVLVIPTISTDLFALQISANVPTEQNGMNKWSEFIPKDISEIISLYSFPVTAKKFSEKSFQKLGSKLWH